MIETAYEKNGWLYVRVNGYERSICHLDRNDRLEGFTAAGVTYVKNGWRYIWKENGSTQTINHV